MCISIEHAVCLMAHLYYILNILNKCTSSTNAKQAYSWPVVGYPFEISLHLWVKNIQYDDQCRSHSGNASIYSNIQKILIANILSKIPKKIQKDFVRHLVDYIRFHCLFKHSYGPWRCWRILKTMMTAGLDMIEGLLTRHFDNVQEWPSSVCPSRIYASFILC